jgi:protein ImuB
MLWVALRFPCLSSATLEQIAAWACQFTPRVSLEPPRELLLEVQGSLRYFGGARSFMARLRAGLADIGIDAALGAAPSARAALWRARGGGGKLEELPIEVACSGEDYEFLKSVGIATIGQVIELPRAGLARRCGSQLLDDIDCAFGRLAEPRAFFAAPRRFAARLELPAEVAHAEGLLFGARRLLAQLEGLLAAHQAGVRSFRLFLISRKGELALEVGLASPARQAERLAQLLRERLGQLSLREPIDAIRLEAGDFTPLHARSAGLFGDAAAEAEDWAQLVERLRARLGHDAVYGLTTQPDHRPELAWRRIEPGDWDAREFRQPGARPLWLLEAPRRLAEGEFALLAGPERIESGWWDGDEASRDYFVARLEEPGLGWIYREAGEWYLHGLFA